MKIGTEVYTNRNGITGFGVIVDKKVISYFNAELVLFKVDSDDFGSEWINRMYLVERDKYGTI